MFSKYLSGSLAVAIIATSGMLSLQVHGQLETGWKTHDLNRPAPKVVTPGEEAHTTKAPSDAVILFDGTSFDHWTGGVGKWKIVDGVMESASKAGHMISKEEFGDCQLHVEWASPAEVIGNGKQRGDSGVFLMNVFELQVLDSYENPTIAGDGAASVYGQHPPLVNACRAPGKWQSYDIIFRSPRFDEDGELQKKARMTVLHNGVLVQDNSVILGPTAWIKHGRYVPGKTTGPIRLQDSLQRPVRYRNIWVRRLEAQRPQPEKPYSSATVDLPPKKLERLVGTYQSEDQQEFHIARKADGIYCKLHRASMKMMALSESEFVFEKCAGKMSFQMSAGGQVESAILELDAAGKRTGKKKGAPLKKGTPPKKRKKNAAKNDSAK